MEFFVDVDDFEESSNPVIHSIAGASAGIMEHCGLYPLDTIRTLQQSTPVSKKKNVWNTAKFVYRRGGIPSFFKGIGLFAVGVGGIHSLSFPIYEVVKFSTGAQDAYHTYHSRVIFAGICATLIHDSFMTPLDMIKQRLQYSATSYSSFFHMIRGIYRTEGFLSFYAGYTTSLSMNIPYASIYYGCYEGLKEFFKGSFGYDNRDHHVLSHLAAGAGAGFIAGGLTNPLDVVKTRLQVRPADTARYEGLLRMFRGMIQDEGLSSLAKGIKARMIIHSMAAAISWTTYEQVKFTLTYFLGPSERNDE